MLPRWSSKKLAKGPNGASIAMSGITAILEIKALHLFIELPITASSSGFIIDAQSLQTLCVLDASCRFVV